MSSVSEQFKMRVSEDFVSALETAARNHNRRSPQQVAEEVIETYLPFWEQAEQLKQNRVAQQREALFGADNTVLAEKAAPLKPRKKGATKTKPKS